MHLKIEKRNTDLKSKYIITIENISNMNNWIEDILDHCSALEQSNSYENQLIDLLLERCYKKAGNNISETGTLLASAFDLLVSAEYYGMVVHSGWLYCPEESPRLFFHFTNCCPRDVISNRFFFNPSNKPTSGKIGTATSRLLLLFIRKIFQRKNFNETVLKGTEPVDAVIVNNETKQVLFAEIKASPLVTLPISIETQRLTKDVNGEIVIVGHISTINSNFYGTPIDVFVPFLKNGEWKESYYRLGQKENEKDIYWAYRGLINLLKDNENFFNQYFAFWQEALKAYQPKSNSDIFWLTNACGTPSPIPQGWQKRRIGSGYESISDSKTSVGMDRTDDIKKGIYQVLKLGAEGKPLLSEWNYKVGIISNIHPARHFEEYLQVLQDIVWTNDETGRASFVKDLPLEQKVFNLFDGIIALTKTYSRDEWIDKLFANKEKI
jgi:hypothetical protein